MSEKRDKEGFLERILKFLSSFMFDRIEKEIKGKIYGYISDIVRSIIRKVMLSAIGAILVLVGFVFICIATVEYLAIYTPIWMSWLIVGIIVLLAGALIATLVLRRK